MSAIQERVQSSDASVTAFGDLKQALDIASHAAPTRCENPAVLLTPASFLPDTAFELAIRKRDGLLETEGERDE